MKISGILLIALVITAPAFSQDQPSNQDLESGLRKANEIWNTSFNNRDTVSFFTLFTKETIWTTYGRSVGIDECKSLVRNLYKRRPDITWTNQAEKVEIYELWKVAYETGVWTETWTSTKDSTKSEVKGKYWITYKFDGQKWTIHQCAFTPLSCVGSYCK